MEEKVNCSEPAQKNSGRNTVGVAIMGYGVVGKGVAHAIRNNGALIERKTGVRVRLLRVLDLLDFPDSPEAGVVTHNVGDIMDDGDIDVVVETMGGVGAAFEFTKTALSRGKHVITSNKELVAEHGPELLALADKCGAFYRFDASVGGGIPVINPIEECLAPDDVDEILGIFNGTTNYMLTYMKAHGAGFIDTLARAQEHGYAEGDPSSDIEGRDPCRKLAIISSIAFGKFIDWKSIRTESLSQVTLDDINRAADIGRVLKYIARISRRADGRFEAYVLPAMVDRRSPLARVEGVNNAVMIHGDLTGYIMLYGPGAGMLPTGNSIASDIVKVACGAREKKGLQYPPGDGGGARSGGCAQFAGLKNPKWDRGDKLDLACFGEYLHGFYVRAEAPDHAAYRDMLFGEFPEARILPRMGGDGPETLFFTVPEHTEKDFNQKLENINNGVAGAATKFVARLIPYRE